MKYNKKLALESRRNSIRDNNRINDRQLIQVRYQDKMHYVKAIDSNVLILMNEYLEQASYIVEIEDTHGFIMLSNLIDFSNTDLITLKKYYNSL